MATVEPWQDAGAAAYRAFANLRDARTLGQQAVAFTDLSNAMHDLATWLPGWGVETGTVREEDGTA